jgi:hypothetical protein
MAGQLFDDRLSDALVPSALEQLNSPVLCDLNRVDEASLADDRRVPWLWLRASNFVDGRAGMPRHFVLSTCESV